MWKELERLTGDGKKKSRGIQSKAGLWGRDGIVFYEDPDVGATATISPAKHLHLLDEIKK